MREGRQHGARAACGSRGLVSAGDSGITWHEVPARARVAFTDLPGFGRPQARLPPTHPVRFPRGVGGTLRAAGAWQRLSQPPTSQGEEEVGWVRKEPCEGAAGAGNHSF